MVVSDANGKAICAALQPPKMERRVARVATPQLIRPDGEFLNIIRESVEQRPETGELQRTSLRRGPAMDQPLPGFVLRLPEQEVQLACGGILIHLLVPTGSFAGTEPISQTLVFFR